MIDRRFLQTTAARVRRRSTGSDGKVDADPAVFHQDLLMSTIPVPAVPAPSVAHSGALQPEPACFEDPAIDRLMGVVMSLASEVWILNDRLGAMERILADKGIVGEDDRRAWAADEQSQLMLDAEREAFVNGLLDKLLGLQVSRGVPRE